MGLLVITMEQAVIPRKTGRPLSFDRQAALQQAMLTFWRHGYETTSISNLTAAMGVTAPSLYTAFGDKKRLFLEAMRLYAGAPEDLQASLDTAPTARSSSAKLCVPSLYEFTVWPSKVTSLMPSATTRSVSRTTSSSFRLRSAPRVNGTMQ